MSPSRHYPKLGQVYQHHSFKNRDAQLHLGVLWDLGARGTNVNIKLMQPAKSSVIESFVPDPGDAGPLPVYRKLWQDNF